MFSCKHVRSATDTEGLPNLSRKKGGKNNGKENHGKIYDNDTSRTKNSQNKKVSDAFNWTLIITYSVAFICYYFPSVLFSNKSAISNESP